MGLKSRETEPPPFCIVLWMERQIFSLERPFASGIEPPF